jgi:ANTAR domain
MVEQQDVEAVEFGTLEEASAAIGRLMTVTRAVYERRAQLEHALQSRVAIEQAKGVLAERYGLGTEEAFALLRRAARTNRMKLDLLAAAVQPGASTPSEIESLLPGSREVVSE